jgi:hypothetical protein
MPIFLSSVQVVAGELNYIDKKVANTIPSSETVKGLPIPSREIPPSSSIPVPHRLSFELSHLAGLVWLAGWPFKMKYLTHQEDEGISTAFTLSTLISISFSKSLSP